MINPRTDQIDDHCTRRHVLVTGASSGNGRATTQRFADAGDHVFATVRSERDARELDGPGITPLLMDVTDHARIRAAAKVITAHTDTLDVLINNAGIGTTGPMEFMALDSLRLILEVNVVGQVAVTQELLPLVRAAQGTIVMIGSIGDRMTIPFGGALASSKYALRSITDALRLELAPWNVKVVLVEPGSIRTAAIDKTIPADPRSVLEGLSADAVALYGTAYTTMIERFRTTEEAGDPPAVVAETIFRAAGSRHPRTRYLTGKDVRRLATIARLPTPLADRLRRRLFGLPGPGSATR